MHSNNRQAFKASLLWTCFENGEFKIAKNSIAWRKNTGIFKIRVGFPNQRGVGESKIIE